MVTAELERQIRENLGLVHTVANRFRGRGIEYDDLYQSGCVGLIKAVDRFDPTLGYAFSTYAVPVIIGEIKRLFRDGGAVKVSRVLKKMALYAARLREDFLRREGREPTIGELAELLSCDPAEAAEIVGVMQPTVSINSAGEDGDTTLDIPVDEILAFEKALLELIDTKYPEIFESIRETKQLDEETEQKLITAIEACKKDFK